MANLSLSEIRKRPGRIETLVFKLVDGSPFELSGSKMFKANSLRVYDKNSLTVFTPKKKDDKQFKDAIDFLNCLS